LFIIVFSCRFLSIFFRRSFLFVANSFPLSSQRSLCQTPLLFLSPMAFIIVNEESARGSLFVNFSTSKLRPPLSSFQLLPSATQLRSFALSRDNQLSSLIRIREKEKREIWRTHVTNPNSLPHQSNPSILLLQVRYRLQSIPSHRPLETLQSIERSTFLHPLVELRSK